MHHALEIQEILLNIFDHCYTPDVQRPASDLAALARTCRVFKEPALDILWEQLGDLTPLVRCIPDASQRSSYGRYSFHRPLAHVEWDILRSYTRRVRYIVMMDVHGLGRKSLTSLFKPPTIEPLFSNARHLHFRYTRKAKPLLFLSFPSLISLHLECSDLDSRDPRFLGSSLGSFVKISPCLTSLSIQTNDYVCTFLINDIDPRFMRQWRNVRIIDCPHISLDATTLVHLSRMPVLTRLDFTLRDSLLDQTSPSRPPLVFSNLHRLGIRSQSLEPISRLFSQIRLPAVTGLFSFIEFRPSRQELSSFCASLQTCCNAHIVQELLLVESVTSSHTVVLGDDPVLGLQDLRPCMAFNNLRSINFAIDWRVELTDSELLSLVSAWPRLEQLYINLEWGWNTPGGITPNGLLQLLQTCRSLRWIALAIDTRGYTEIPPSPASLGLTLPHMSAIDVLDSLIEAESVPAITAFFTGIVHSSDFLLSAWSGRRMFWNPNQAVYKVHWEDVFERVKDAASQRFW